MFFAPAAIFAQASADSIVHWNVSAKKINDGTYELTAKGTLPKNWYLYGKNSAIEGLQTLNFSFTDESIHTINDVSFNSLPQTITSSVFDNKKVNVYTNDVEVKQQIKIAGVIPPVLKGSINFYISSADNFYTIEQLFQVQLEGGIANNNTAAIKKSTIDLEHPLADCGERLNIGKESMLTIFFLGFVGGLIALLTPCMFPMIPVTVSFFTKRSNNRSQAIKRGALYGFFIFLIYVLTSLPFHLLNNVSPEILNNISSNAWLNIIFFVVFIVFAISFFGYFEITLPSSVANKADSKSNLGSVGGIFFMALTLVIVSFSCTGIILGTILAGTSSHGAMPLTICLSGFGLALGLPFALFAIFPNLLHSLPKSGGWLDTVKKVLAFIEVALAFKFLSNADTVMHWGILKREIFIAIWVVTGIGLALYLFGFIHLPHDDKGNKISVGRKILAVITLAFVIYLIPGLTNTQYSNLKLLSGLLPAKHYSIYKEDKGSLKADVMNDYEKALQLAKQQHKPLLIDFTGWVCTNCRNMEENVWTQPEVYNYIKNNFILVSLYVDDKEKLPAAERLYNYKTKDGKLKDIITVGDKWATFEYENFGATSQPLYAIIDNEERLVSLPVGYTPNVAKYKQWLECSKNKFDGK